jgi:hypothetical protein
LESGCQRRDRGQGRRAESVYGRCYPPPRDDVCSIVLLYLCLSYVIQVRPNKLLRRHWHKIRYICNERQRSLPMHPWGGVRLVFLLWLPHSLTLLSSRFSTPILFLLLNSTNYKDSLKMSKCTITSVQYHLNPVQSSLAVYALFLQGFEYTNGEWQNCGKTWERLSQTIVSPYDSSKASEYLISKW